MKYQITPSILSANFADLLSDIKMIESGGADLLHIDIMDGHFVPNLTIGPVVVKSLQGKTKLPFDVHLMITDPTKYADPFIAAGADIINFHIEALPNAGDLIRYIKKQGVKAALTINPPTAVEAVLPYLDDIDMLLVMSVNPGFAGQSFMAEVLPKIVAVRKLKPELDIQIDGGISRKTIKQAAEAGANIFVAGSAIFGAEDPARELSVLRELIQLS